MKYLTITIKGKKIDDFAKERNYALGKAKSEWVFFLDSDEVMSRELKSEIRNLNPGPSINGYFIPRRGIVEERLLRLAKRSSGKWHRKVHEVWKIDGKVGYLKNPIIHSDDKTLFKMIEKINFYSTLHAQASKKEGKKATIFKIIFFPKVKFFQTYFLKKAYKSGLKGFIFSLMQAFQSFLSWTKLYFLSF
jgi:hypothetical protein